MRVTIRRGELNDAAQAAELWLRARKAARGAIPATVHSDTEVREWFAGHVAPRLELWLAEATGGELVGLLVLDAEWIDQLYVDPAHTGRGIGSRLLAHAKRERPGGLKLWTFQSNDRAQRFYEHRGFQEIERTDGQANEERAPDILYAYGDLRAR